MALRFRRFLMLGLPLAAIVASLHTAASADAATPEFRGVQLHSLWFDSSNADMDRELDLARESRAFLSGRGVDLTGEQQTKTRAALEFFAGRLRDKAVAGP